MAERKKPAGPKPWAGRVKSKQRAKQHRRKYWSRSLWMKHHRLREQRRQRPRLPRIMSSRQTRKRELALSAARSARMRAYNARRRAAKADTSCDET